MITRSQQAAAARGSRRRHKTYNDVVYAPTTRVDARAMPRARMLYRLFDAIYSLMHGAVDKRRAHDAVPRCAEKITMLVG